MQPERQLTVEDGEKAVTLGLIDLQTGMIDWPGIFEMIRKDRLARVLSRQQDLP